MECVSLSPESINNLPILDKVLLHFKSPLMLKIWAGTQNNTNCSPTLWLHISTWLCTPVGPLTCSLSPVTEDPWWQIRRIPVVTTARKTSTTPSYRIRISGKQEIILPSDILLCIWKIGYVADVDLCLKIKIKIMKIVRKWKINIKLIWFHWTCYFDDFSKLHHVASHGLHWTVAKSWPI